MAQLATIEPELGPLPQNVRGPLLNAFRAFIRTLRFGRATSGDASENFSAGFYEATTPPVASTEFSIVHGFGRAPYLVVPVLDLQQAGTRIVPLEVTRVADANRLYLKSTVASAPIKVFVEG